MARTVAVNLVANVGQYVSGMNTAAGATVRLGESATTASQKTSSGFDLASKGALLLGGAVVGGLGMAINSAANFEKAMSGISAATHASGGEMEKFRSAAMKAGADTQYSATEAANAITEMAKAGVSSADILGGGLRGALSLAAAGQLDVAEASGIAATAMTQFNLTGSDLPHVADLLAAGAGKAMGSVDELGQALNQSGLIASAAGLSIEETTGTLASFANAGLIGSDAGTSFKTMLQALQAPSSKAAELMSQLGINMYDSQGNMLGAADMAGVLHDKLGGLSQEQRNAALATIFGSDAVRAANVLYNEGQAGIQGWIDKVNDQGYAAETARKQNDNLKGDLERLGGAFETLMIKMGEGSQGPLRALVGGLTEVVSAVAGDKAAFESLPAPIQIVLSAFDGMASLVGGVVSVFGSLPGPVQTAIVTLGAVAALKGPVGSAFETIALKALYMGDSLSGVSFSMGGLKAAGAGLLGFFGGPWGLAITGATLGLSALVSWLGSSSEASTAAKNAAQGYASALEQSNGAIDANVRLSAAKAAEDSGLLAVADNVGIKLDMVTSAITGQSGALDTVRSKLQAYIDANTIIFNTENGPEKHLNAQAKAAQEALNSLGALAGQTGATEESQGRVSAAAGATTQSIQAEQAAMQAATEAQSKLGESMAAFVDPLAVYQGLMEQKKAADQQSAEAAATAATGSSQSWKDFVVSTGFSFDEYMRKLEEQVQAQTNWQQNMLYLAGRVSQGTLDELARMGPEGAPLVADLVNRSDAELDRFDDITYLRSKEATDAWGQQLSQAAPVLAEVGKQAGWGVVKQLSDQLQAGTTTVAQIAAQYGIKLADGVNPVLTALGKQRIQYGQLASGSNGMAYAEGGIRERHVAQIARGGDWRVWAEDETGGEAYIPLHRNKRSRSLDIWKETGKRLGVNMRAFAQGSIVDMGHRLQSMGARVTEHPAFPPLSMTGHGKTSLHYTGHAIDVNTRSGQSAAEQRELAPMAALARSLGFRTIFMAPEHYDHLHVDDGGTGSIGSTGVMMTVNLPKPPSTAPYALPISTAADASMEKIYNDAMEFVAANTIAPEAAGAADSGNTAGYRALGRTIAASMGVGGQFGAIDSVFTRESNWNPNAQNPTSSAYGIPQFLNATWAAYGGKTSDPGRQITAGIRYMNDRYGSPNGALAFWNSHHWYDDGDILPPGLSMAYNGTGRNEQKAVFTNEQWGALQNLASQQISGGSSVVTVPAPIVNIYIDGEQFRGMSRTEAAGVVENKLSAVMDTLHGAGV